MSTRTDVHVFDLIPDALKALRRWECWRYVDGEQTPIDVKTGRPAYSHGFSVSFAEALEYFVAHEEVAGLFFRINESPEAAEPMVRSAMSCGCRVTYNKPQKARGRS
jgi:hypothetical protein